MCDTGVFAQQRDFTELVSDRGTGCGKPLVSERHFQHRVFALRDRFKYRRIFTQQLLNRDSVNLIDFATFAVNFGS